MGLFDKLRRRKYFRFDLFLNEGEGWKKFGDYKEFLDYKDIENPDSGSILRLYGVKQDLSAKEGYTRTLLWEHEVPTPGGKKAKGEKEKSIEEKLMEKLVENADFSHLSPSKMSIPLGKTGGSLDFEAPTGGGGSGSGGYIIMGDSKYPLGELPPLEFEGKLPSWMHPAAGVMIMSLVDRFGGMIKEAIGGAITQTTGIKKKEVAKEGVKKEEKVEEAPDLVGELDEILEEKGKKGEK